MAIKRRPRDTLTILPLFALVLVVERVTRRWPWVFGALLLTALGLFTAFFLAAMVYT